MPTSHAVPIIDLSDAPDNVQAAFRLLFDLLERVDTHFEQLEARTAQLEEDQRTTLETLEARVEQLEERSAALDQLVAMQEERGDVTRERVDSIVEHYAARTTVDALDDQLSTLEYRFTDCSHTVEQLERRIENVAALENRIHALEWGARSR